MSGNALLCLYQFCFNLSSFFFFKEHVLHIKSRAAIATGGSFLPYRFKCHLHGNSFDIQLIYWIRPTTVCSVMFKLWSGSWGGETNAAWEEDEAISSAPHHEHVSDASERGSMRIVPHKLNVFQSSRHHFSAWRLVRWRVMICLWCPWHSWWTLNG